MTFSKEDLPDEPIFVYHVTSEDHLQSIKDNGLKPHYTSNTMTSSIPESVSHSKTEVEDLITQIAMDSSKYPDIIRDNCVYFWVNEETVIEKANSLLDVGRKPVIIGLKYEQCSNPKYLADMRLFTEAVDRYIYLKEGSELTLRDYSKEQVSKKTIIQYLIKYLEKIEKISKMEDMMNILELYDCPELLVEGEVKPDELYFFKLE